MANVKISALPAVTTVVPGTDVLPLVSNSGVDTTKATPQQIVNAALASPAAIGTGTAAAGTFTELTASSPSVISVNSSSDALRITQTGSGNALVVEDSANPDSTPFVVDNAGRVGIGGAPGAGQRFLLSGSLSGATTAYGQWNYLTPQSDVTSAAIGYATNLQTAAASFSLSELSHYKSIQGGLGASSVVTNQYGFNVTSSLTGATNNYGFYSNIASGTGRWNFYAAGAADNYFAGRVGIGDAGLTSFNLLVSKNITGATTSFGIGNFGSVQSDVTTEARYLGITTNTAAASFTLPSLSAIAIYQGTFGAGSTVTNQYGVYVGSNLTGATNNYGFYSNIASGTGRYNFYAAGTADNYFAGPLTFTPASSATPANNGNLTFEATSNTSLTIKLKGSDGTVRSVALTLA